MTLSYGPACTCGVMQPYYYATLPCPLHGYNPGRSWTTAATTYVVSKCPGRHCAHTAECRGPFAMNGI